MVVVRDLVGQIGDLRFEGRLLFADKARADIAQFFGVLDRAMLQDSFARFKTKVQSFKGGIVLLQHIDHAQGLQIVLEATVVLHALVKRVLPGMAEGRMPEVVRQCHGLDQIFIEREAACHRSSDLRNLNAVRQAGSEEVAFVVDEYLGLVFKSAKRGRVDDPVAIALEFAATRGRGFRELPATGYLGMRCVNRQIRHAQPLLPGRPANHALQNPPSGMRVPATSAIPGEAFRCRLSCHGP